MPIGVPKVPVTLPDEEEPQFVDLYHRMFQERLLFMCPRFREMNLLIS